MNILNVNIMEMVTERANFTITIKNEVLYELLIVIFTFDYDPIVQIKVMQHLDSEYLGKGERQCFD